MSYTDFVKPYVDGYENGESGNTPLTAEILNNNYDAFLIALNTWAAGVPEDANYVHTDNNYTTNEKNKLSGIASGATVTAFSRVVATGTKLGTLTINGTDYDIYAPNAGAGSLSDLSDVTLSSPSNGQVLKYDSTSGKWINANESGGGGGSYSPNGVTYVIDNNGTDSVTTGHTYAYENKISKYVDGVLDSSGSWSYAQSMTTPTNYFIVGNLKSTYTNISGTAYWIVTVVDGYVRYNNVVYEENEEIFRVAVRSGIDESITGFEEVVEVSPSVVEWDQIQQTGTKIATITIDGTDIDVYAPTSGGASSFSGLSDVDISTPSTGQVPIYNATTSKWENGALNVGDDVSFTPIQQSGTKIGTITINSTDYDIYAPTSGGASSLSGLSDVALNSPSNGQILEYDGTTSKWKNANAPTVPDEITDLSDVSVSSLQNGQILKWNSTSSKWENANESGGGGTSGGGFTKTSLYTASQIQDSAPLSQDISNFDLIEVVCWYDANSRLYTQNAIYNADELIASINASPKNRFLVSNDTMTCWFEVEDTDELIRYQGDMHIKQVYGINFGSNYKEITGTLTAGSTSITLSDASITTSSTIEVFNDLDVPYNSKTVSTGSITLTFDAQQSNMTVKVRVS